MKLQIVNKDLAGSLEMLKGLPLRGKQSRHRSKLVKILQKNLDEVVEQEMEIVNEHAHKDDNGNPKTLLEGQFWDLKDQVAFAKDRNELLNEVAIVEGGANEEMLKTVYRLLEECDQEFSGNSAEIYDMICEQLEESDESEEGSDES